MNDEAEIIGCGPFLQSPDSALRPLRQQVFEHVRALGRVPRVQVAKDLRVSPASVTTITSELIETGFLEEVQAGLEGGLLPVLNVAPTDSTIPTCEPR